MRSNLLREPSLARVRLRTRVFTLGYALASLVCAGVAIKAVSTGLSVNDRWLFSMLVLVPGIASIGLALTLCGSAELRSNVALLIIASGGSLYAIETVLLAVPDNPPLTERSSSTTGRASVDRRSRREVIADLRAAGTDAFPAFGASGLRSLHWPGDGEFTLDGRRIIPLALVPNRFTVHCNEAGQYTAFHTDERGFNNPPGSWQSPIGAAFVGDSFIQGACVDSAQSLIANLRRWRSDVLGLGLDGAGPLSMLGMIKEYLPSVRPIDVFWFYYEGNDLPNLTEELRLPELRMYLEPGKTQGLIEHQSEIERALVEMTQAGLSAPDEPQVLQPDERSKRVMLQRWSTLYRVRRGLALADVGSRMQACCDIEMFEKTLLEAKREVATWRGRLHFVYLPAFARYDRAVAAIFDDALRQRSQVLRTVERLGVPIVDVHTAFEETADPTSLFTRAGSHYNAAGYRVAAKAVLRHLGQFEQ